MPDRKTFLITFDICDEPNLNKATIIKLDGDQMQFTSKDCMDATDIYDLVTNSNSWRNE